MHQCIIKGYKIPHHISFDKNYYLSKVILFEIFILLAFKPIWTRLFSTLFSVNFRVNQVARKTI